MLIKNSTLYDRDPAERLIESFKGKILSEIASLKTIQAKNQSAEAIYERIYKEADDFPVLLPDKATIKPYREEPRDYPKLPNGHRAFIQTIPAQSSTTAYYFYSRPTKNLGKKPVGVTAGPGALLVSITLTEAEVNKPDEARQKIEDFFQRNLESIMLHHTALEEELRSGVQLMKDEFIAKIEERRQFLFSADKLDSFFT